MPVSQERRHGGLGSDLTWQQRTERTVSPDRIGDARLISAMRVRMKQDRSRLTRATGTQVFLHGLGSQAAGPVCSWCRARAVRGCHRLRSDRAVDRLFNMTSPDLPVIGMGYRKTRNVCDYGGLDGRELMGNIHRSVRGLFSVGVPVERDSPMARLEPLEHRGTGNIGIGTESEQGRDRANGARLEGRGETDEGRIGGRPLVL